VPARIWLGSAMRGLAARSSGQRLPLPRFCCASFQSESPRCTLTVFRVAIATELGAGCGRTGRTVAIGAAGWAGFAGADGCIGWMTIFGVAGRENIFGCAGEISRAFGRTAGRTSSGPLERISGRRTSGRIGTLEKGSRRKTFDGVLGEEGLGWKAG